jgi:ferritin-like metal-binding protein YciE
LFGGISKRLSSDPSLPSVPYCHTLFIISKKLLIGTDPNIMIRMSPRFNGNHSLGSSSANPIIVAGLNLALSYENAAIDRLEKRISETVVPEVREKLKRHLLSTKEQQDRLKQRIEAIGGFMQPTSEKGKLPIPEPPSTLKMMIENNSSNEEREVWESLNDLIIERAEAIMYKGGIQALELLKADKKTIDTLKKNLKEEESFGDWLERNNPKMAKRLMTKQVEQNKKRGKKNKRQEKEQAILAASAA